MLGRGRAALHQPLCPGQPCSLQPPLAPSGHCCPPQSPTLTGRDEKQVQQRQHRHLQGGPSTSPSTLSWAMLSQLELTPGDASTHGGAISFPLLFFCSSSCLPRELRARPWCVVLSLGQGWRPLICLKYCSSCVLQSVSHADRRVSISHTGIMPLAYRNMYSQPCSPPLSALLSSLLRYVSERG